MCKAGGSIGGFSYVLAAWLAAAMFMSWASNKSNFEGRTMENLKLPIANV